MWHDIIKAPPQWMTKGGGNKQQCKMANAFSLLQLRANVTRTIVTTPKIKHPVSQDTPRASRTCKTSDTRSLNS